MSYAEGDSARIVVGVDGTRESRHAVARALEEAARRKEAVELVHAYEYPPPLLPFYDAATELGEDCLQPVPGGLSASAAAQQWRLRADEVSHELLVSETLAGEGQRFPEVAVTTQVVRDHPVRALLDAARNAALLVVGARGTGGYPGLELGSVALGGAAPRDLPGLRRPGLTSRGERMPSSKRARKTP